MGRLRQVARTLRDGALRGRQRFAQRLLAELQGSERRADTVGRPSVLWRLAHFVYLLKRLAQAALAAEIPLSLRGFAFWKRKIDTAFHVKLFLWATCPVGRKFDPYRAHRINNRLTPDEAERMKRLAQSFEVRPLVSIVTPVYNAEPGWLDRLVFSVSNQTYDRWELILVDDGSSSPATRAALEKYADCDERIVVERLGVNGGVSAATNRGADLAHGEFLAFVDHDDELTPDALWHVVERLQRQPDCDVVYTDEELAPAGQDACYPFLKPDFSPELLTAYNYLCHLLVVRKRLFDEVGQLRSETDGAQDYDLVLRLIERTDLIAHVPRVLYRWHVVPKSYSREIDPKTRRLKQAPALDPVTRRVVQESLDRRGIAADCEIEDSWSLPRFRPVDRGKVSIVICTRDQPLLVYRAVRSIERKTQYPNYEIVIVDNGSRSLLGRLCRWWLSRRWRVLNLPNGPEGFSFSRLNNEAARQVDGKYVLFLNDDTRVVARGWLSALVGYQQFKGVGACGARLVFPSGATQHAGVILGAMGWGPWHALIGVKPRTAKDHMGYITFPHNSIAVTGACMLTPRTLFLESGGFDEKQFAVSFNDVDYCLRLVRQGYRMAYVPQAKLIHYEGRSRGKLVDAREIAALRARYHGWSDPYWNPNFSRETPHFAVSSRRRARGLTSRSSPRVLIAARRSRETDPWPHWEPLFRALCKRTSLDLRVVEPDNGRRWPTRLRREMARDGGVDVAFAQGREMAVVVESAHQAGVPAVWHLPGLLTRASGPWPAAGAELLKVSRAMRLAYQVVFTNPHSLAWAACGEPRDNFAVIDGTLFDDLAQGLDRASARARLRRDWQIGDDAVVALGILPLHELASFKIVLKAHRRLKRWARRNAFLLLVAQGEPDYRNLRRLRKMTDAAGGSVGIVVEPEDLRDCYAGADVFVSLPGTDIRPLTVLRAMQFGLPLVGPKPLVEADLLYPGGNGLVADMHCPGSVARALQSLFADRRSRRRFGENSRAWLDSRAHPEAVLASWAELMQEASELNPRAGIERRGPSASQVSTSGAGRPADAVSAGAAANAGSNRRNAELPVLAPFNADAKIG